jgi:hypothetical protein
MGTGSIANSDCVPWWFSNAKCEKSGGGFGLLKAGIIFNNFEFSDVHVKTPFL